MVFGFPDSALQPILLGLLAKRRISGLNCLSPAGEFSGRPKQALEA
jgi:hypothetical protein